jgi:NFU1 iron-sulfur cluster scaffold homolog, mitochondrial
MGFGVIEIQPTPNPNAMKFVLDAPVSHQPISFFNAAAADGFPLATALFAIEGVSSLLLLGDFITINKSPKAVWADITPKARAVLAAAKND